MRLAVEAYVIDGLACSALRRAGGSDQGKAVGGHGGEEDGPGVVGEGEVARFAVARVTYCHGGGDRDFHAVASSSGAVAADVPGERGGLGDVGMKFVGHLSSFRVEAIRSADSVADRAVSSSFSYWAMSELAANAESHTTPPWQLWTYRFADALWLAIIDPDLRAAWTVLQRLRTPSLPSDTAQTCGWGLFLVSREFPNSCWVRPVSLGADGKQGKEILLHVPLTIVPV